MKFMGFLKLSGNLRVVTGLHIGGGSAGVSIGATDNPVIKVNGKPYIPGSSLKGKVRSLLELAYGKEIDDELGRHECKNLNPCDICIVFGRGAERKGKEGPTRVIFRDCNINEKESDEEARKNGYTEIKMENAINRLTSRVEVGLRDTERVLPGTVFNVEILYRIYDKDVDSEIKDVEKIDNLPEPLKTRFKLILEGLKLLEDDYLGGKGTRGYGKVKLENIKIELIPLEFYRGYGESKVIFSGTLEEAVRYDVQTLQVGV